MTGPYVPGVEGVPEGTSDKDESLGGGGIIHGNDATVAITVLIIALVFFP